MIEKVKGAFLEFNYFNVLFEMSINRYMLLLSTYYALLTCVLENKNTPDDQLSDAQKQVEEDLKLIQYDISIGKNYVSKYNDFFKIK